MQHHQKCFEELGSIRWENTRFELYANLSLKTIKCHVSISHWKSSFPCIWSLLHWLFLCFRIWKISSINRWHKNPFPNLDYFSGNMISTFQSFIRLSSPWSRFSLRSSYVDSALYQLHALTDFHRTSKIIQCMTYWIWGSRLTQSPCNLLILNRTAGNEEVHKI